MGRMRMLLINAEHAEAISLYRAARLVSLLYGISITPSAHFREVWPGAEFGSSGMSVDEEMDGVRDILLNQAAGVPS